MFFFYLTREDSSKRLLNMVDVYTLAHDVLVHGTTPSSVPSLLTWGLIEPFGPNFVQRQELICVSLPKDAAYVSPQDF